jgi:hypothetical protein
MAGQAGAGTSGVLQTGLARPDLIALQHAAEEAAAAKQGRRRPASTQAELRMAAPAPRSCG